MLDVSATIIGDAARGGRASRKERMTRPRYQEGCLWIRGKRRKMWVVRWRENGLEPDGAGRRIQRAETLGPVSKITRQQVRAFLQGKAATINLRQRRPQAFISLEEFVRVEWRPNAALALKKSTVKYYGFQLDRHILPALGNCSLYDISRSQIESVLSEVKRKGHSSGTIRGVRATFSTVLQSAMERGHLDKNPAHGIRIRTTVSRIEHRFYSPAQVRQLLPELTEPCRTVVELAVLTGLRIGEILALRSKRVNLLRGTLEVAESYSDGEFGLPKTRSSSRVIPISGFLRGLLESHRTYTKRIAPNDLVFSTPTGTQLNQKNLYNRVLAPACDRIKQPRAPWHSFRHR